MPNIWEFPQIISSLPSSLFQTDAEGNVTVSILTFRPTIDDMGKHLSCRAEMAVIPDAGKEDGWNLIIHRKYSTDQISAWQINSLKSQFNPFTKKKMQKSADIALATLWCHLRPAAGSSAFTSMKPSAIELIWPAVIVLINIADQVLVRPSCSWLPAPACGGNQPEVVTALQLVG